MILLSVQAVFSMYSTEEKEKIMIREHGSDRVLFALLQVHFSIRLIGFPPT